jgi:hypothetical protein
MTNHPTALPEIDEDTITIPANTKRFTVVVMWYHPIFDTFSNAVIYVLAVDKFAAATTAEMNMRNSVRAMLIASTEWDDPIEFGSEHDTQIIPPEATAIFEGSIEVVATADEIYDHQQAQFLDDNSETEVDDVA